MPHNHLKVLVNARPLFSVLTGIARYTRSLYQAILEQDLAEVRFVCNSEVTGDLPLLDGSGQKWQIPWQLRLLLREARRIKNDAKWKTLTSNRSGDVYHETGMFAAKHARHVPAVLTVYDLSLLHFPQHHPPDRVRFFNRHFLKRLDEVSHVLTISEFVRSEIIKTLGVDPARVTAIPLAADPVFRESIRADTYGQLAASGLPEKYILYIGTMEPRKNLAQVLRAMSSMDSKIPLVCAGASGWQNEDFDAEIRRLGLSSRMRNLGHVSDENLVLLYNGATVFVYPSLYEGFGLPVLEAMACGCPVICSDRASLPEVVGDAAIQVPALDDMALAEAIDSVTQDQDLQNDMVRRGKLRASYFSWQRTAQQTIDVFRATIDQ